jgi:hypothetical protein
VTHYSTARAFSRDRRAPDEVPLTYAINGGLVFADPSNLGDQDRYRSIPLPPGTSVGRLDLRVDQPDLSGSGVRDLLARTLRRARRNPDA